MDFNQLLFPALLIGVFYLFMIRPQQKEKKLFQTMLNELKKGDKILTSSGIYGEIAEIQDETKIVVKLGQDMKVEMSKSAVAKKL